MMDFSKMSLNEVKEYANTLKASKHENIVAALLSDQRKSVQAFAHTLNRRAEKQRKEEARMMQMIEAERALFNGHMIKIAGIDEAGRGPLAGPVVASAVIMDYAQPIAGIDDSKKLSQKQREVRYDEIMRSAVAVGVGIVEHTVIDEINILNATKRAMNQAVGKLDVKPDVLLIDAVRLNLDIEQKSAHKADALYYSVAAASIIAKVTRDRLMTEYAQDYPMYGFESHKGYGTAQHIEAIMQYGPTPIHRLSFLDGILKGPDKQAKSPLF